MPINGEIGPIYLPSASAASVYSLAYILQGRSGLPGSAAFIRCAENQIDGIFGCPQAATLLGSVVANCPNVCEPRQRSRQRTYARPVRPTGRGSVSYARRGKRSQEPGQGDFDRRDRPHSGTTIAAMANTTHELLRELREGDIDAALNQAVESSVTE